MEVQKKHFIKTGMIGLFSLIGVLLIGFLIQWKSSSIYSEPVLKVDTAEIEGEQQIIKGRILNRPETEELTIKEAYTQNEALAPRYHKNDQLILQKDGTGWRVNTLKRDGWVFILVGSFVWAVLMIGGMKGLRALSGVLLNSLLLVLVLWLNQQNSKFPLLYLMVGYTIAAVCIAMGISYGFKALNIRKALATLLSVLAAFFICFFAMTMMSDKGLRYEEMQFLTRPYRTVFLSSLLIGAIGASMDNVVMIISSMDEIKKQNNQLTVTQLIQSGRAIAQDTTSSMMNVLMFAYLSGAIPSFVFYSANGWSFRETFNMHLSLELLRTLCGGFALVLSVPISLASVLLVDRIERRRLK